ncbi:MAG: archaetidylserine decarboxylase [Deltaproteobacteria bacterium]|nr:archaetidylserine decarboxylase [Deltaproteobacteria bacterium]
MGKLYYYLFLLFPKSGFSRMMGKLAQASAPPWLLAPLIRVYVAWFGIDMGQFELPASGSWENFNEFFARPLKPGARPIDPGKNSLVSPVDGRVSESGEIREGRLYQAKGLSYSLQELLGGGPGWESYDGGTFITIYLSPRDYHRIHTPCRGRVSGFHYLPGELWTVSPSGVNGVPRLFSRNERIVSWLDTDFGQMALVAVGATVVGGIKVVYHSVTSNQPGARELAMTLPQPHELNKGAELGRFLLGSTVVLLARPGEARLDKLAHGHPLRLGEVIGAIEKK